MAGAVKTGKHVMGKCNIILVEQGVSQLIQQLRKAQINKNVDTFLVDFNSSIENEQIIRLFARVHNFKPIMHNGTLDELLVKFKDIGYTDLNIERL